MERVFWYNEWGRQWQEATFALLDREIIGPNVRDVHEATTRLVVLLDTLRKWEAGEQVGWLHGGRTPDLDVWEHRIIVTYLRTGKYEGPVRRDDLPEPFAAWPDDRIGVLAADWGDVVTDVSRKNKVHGYPAGHSKMLRPYSGPTPGERWEIVAPLVFGYRDLITLEALWERLQVIMAIVTDLTKNWKATIPGHVPVASRHRYGLPRSEEEFLWDSQGLINGIQRALDKVEKKTKGQ